MRIFPFGAIFRSSSSPILLFLITAVIFSIFYPTESDAAFVNIYSNNYNVKTTPDLPSNAQFDACMHRQQQFDDGRTKRTLLHQVSVSQAAATTFSLNQNVIWKLRLSPDTSSPMERLMARVKANLKRWECLLAKDRSKMPAVFLPKNAKMMVLEAYAAYNAVTPVVRKTSSGDPTRAASSTIQKAKQVQIGRFGITVQPGPPAKILDQTAKELFGSSSGAAGGAAAASVFGEDIDKEESSFQNVRVAAIIYMFVEPPYRSLGVGDLALDLIQAIHAQQGADYTTLVADDNGSGKLVQWYLRNGFVKAPQLQDFLGSPNGQYGVTMMAPTKARHTKATLRQKLNILQSVPIEWW